MTAEPNTGRRIAFIGQGVEYVFHELAERARRRGFEVVECDFLKPGWHEAMQAFKGCHFTLVSSHHFYLGRESYSAHHGFPVDMPTLADFVSEFRPARVLYVPHDLGYPIKDNELGALKYVDCALMPSDAFWWLGNFTSVVECGWIKWLSTENPPAQVFELAFIPSEIPALLRKEDEEIDNIFKAILMRKPVMLLPPFPGTERLAALAANYGATVLDNGTNVSDVIQRSHAVVSSGQSSVLLEAACAGRPTLCVRDYTLPDSIQMAYVAQIPGVRLDNATSGLVWLDAVRNGEIAFKPPSIRVKPFNLDLFWQQLGLVDKG